MSVILLLCCFMCTIPVWAQYSVRGIVKDSKEQIIIGASVVVKSKTDSLYCKGGTTDKTGNFAIEGLVSGEYGLEITFLGYSNHYQDLKLDQTTNMGVIHLQETSLDLGEVVVTASVVKRFADKKEYKLTSIEKGQYSSALSALEFLPKIQVLDQSVSSVDGKAVKILINGVPSAPTDLFVISPENISKIDYYTQPPTKNIPSMALVELSYKPVKNLTVTSGIRYPFYDSWKQVTSVSGTSLLHRTETERITNNANMVYMNLVYNFSFGKSKSGVKLKMQNRDKDSGILNRK